MIYIVSHLAIAALYTIFATLILAYFLPWTAALLLGWLLSGVMTLATAWLWSRQTPQNRTGSSSDTQTSGNDTD